MSLSSPASASFRRSYWADSYSTPSLDTQGSRSQSRFASLRSSRSSSSRGSIHEASPTARAFARASRLRRDSIAPALTKRMSFIDFGEDSSSRLFGSLKGRMQRKRSAPLLGSSPSTVAPNEPSTPYAASPSRLTMSQFLFRIAQDDAVSLLDVDTNPTLSFKDDRKRTLVPEEIVDGVGYGIRESRLSTVAESEVDEDVDCSKAGYRALPFRKKNGMTLHSYLRSEAPYMRSYNKVDLQNDTYFHLLLRRLNPTGTPSFLEYAFPPNDVLDLGCGQGAWVQEAAAAWPIANIVGFDLVDLVSDSLKPHSNITWRRGNFVVYRLPFATGSFDLVRLSNLTEAVPQDRWENVLVEVRRVLKPAGRVEIIDDETIFPYPHLAPKASTSKFVPNNRSRAVRSSWGSHRSNLSNEISAETSDAPGAFKSSFLDLDSTANRESVSSVPSLCRGETPSEESTDYLQTPTEAVKHLATLLEEKNPPSAEDSQSLATPLSQEIESIYTRMQEDVYNIDLRPGDFLEALLRKVFGPAGKAKTMKDFQISLLSPEMHDLVVMTQHPGATHRRSNKLLKQDRDTKRVDKNKEIMDKVIISQSKSKALRVLGADDSASPAWNPISTHASDDSDIYEDQTAAQLTTQGRALSGILALPFPTSSRPSSSSSTASQSRGQYKPAGLFLFPDQFLETTPFELERYLCKHIDALLSCRAALDDYVLGLQDENDNAIVQEDEWHDMLWEYERSRRERFNLSNPGGLFDDAEDEEDDSANLLNVPIRHTRTLNQAVAAAINKQSIPRSTFSNSLESTTHPSMVVRRIRVFEAYKIKPSLPS